MIPAVTPPPERKIVDALDALTIALRLAMHDDDDNADLARHIASAILEAGGTITIDSDDPEDEDYSEDTLPLSRRVATTQIHRLLVDKEEVATLEREGWSHFGDPDHPDTPAGEWTTDSGQNDQQPSNAWRAVADLADGDDDWDYHPGAEEPKDIDPAPDAEGAYCLWWSTVGDDSGPLPHTRYATLDDAHGACQLANQSLHVTHRGQLLCGYGIAVLEDGEWIEYDGDAD